MATGPENQLNEITHDLKTLATSVATIEAKIENGLTATSKAHTAELKELSRQVAKLEGRQEAVSEQITHISKSLDAAHTHLTTADKLRNDLKEQLQDHELKEMQMWNELTTDFNTMNSKNQILIKIVGGILSVFIALMIYLIVFWADSWADNIISQSSRIVIEQLVP